MMFSGGQDDTHVKQLRKRKRGETGFEEFVSVDLRFNIESFVK